MGASVNLSNPNCQVLISATLPVSSGAFNAAGQVSHLSASTYPIGSAAGSVDTVYTKTLTGTTTLTLSALTDPAGTSIAFGHVVEMIVENLSLTSTVAIAPGASNGVSGWGPLPTAGITFAANVAGSPNSCWYMRAPNPGLAVAASSADEITFTVTGSVQYKVTILGRSA